MRIRGIGLTFWRVLAGVGGRWGMGMISARNSDVVVARSAGVERGYCEC